MDMAKWASQRLLSTAFSTHPPQERTEHSKQPKSPRHYLQSAVWLRHRVNPNLHFFRKRLPTHDLQDALVFPIAPQENPVWTGPGFRENSDTVAPDWHPMNAHLPGKHLEHLK